MAPSAARAVSYFNRRGLLLRKQDIESGSACHQTITIINPACVCSQIDCISTALASAVSLEAAENKTVNGDSYVGNVNSNGGQAKFAEENGKANDENGVGLSTR